jgi:outer membrane receptor protein involved in Fe transport
MEYDYDNKTTDGDIVVTPFYQSGRTVTYHHVADTSVTYNRLSAKLGATYQLTASDSLYMAYREAFRAPSEGQLFRPGRSTNTLNLKPVKIQNREIGFRGKRSDWRYDMAIYSMIKRDDIVTYTHSDGSRESVNAGETLHEGTELGLAIDITSRLSFDLAASYAKHTYEAWVVNTTGTDYSGKEMSTAPRQIMSARLGYKPGFLNNGLIELEWEKLGAYWMDNANTTRYEGHTLYNLRINYALLEKLELYGRVMNMTDERYATNASYSSSAGEEFAPGMPRTVYVGLSYQLF